MTSCDVSTSIAFALGKIKSNVTLKKEQFLSISAILNDRDVLTVLPTGFGKSLIYQLLPDIYSGDDKLSPILKPVVDELREKKENMPLTVIYGNLSTCSDCFSFFNLHLGNEQYYPAGADTIAKNGLFSQFHAQYPNREKQGIVHLSVICNNSIWNWC